jgi:hypothetical protein
VHDPVEEGRQVLPLPAQACLRAAAMEARPGLRRAAFEQRKQW